MGGERRAGDDSEPTRLGDLVEARAFGDLLFNRGDQVGEGGIGLLLAEPGRDFGARGRERHCRDGLDAIDANDMPAESRLGRGESSALRGGKGTGGELGTGQRTELGLGLGAERCVGSCESGSLGGIGEGRAGLDLGVKRLGSGLGGQDQLREAACFASGIFGGVGPVGGGDLGFAGGGGLGLDLLDQRVAHHAALGQRVAGDVLLIPALDLGLARGGTSCEQRSGHARDAADAALEQQRGVGKREARRRAHQPCAGREQLAADQVAADVSTELGLGDLALGDRGAEGGFVETAGGAAEGRNAGDLAVDQALARHHADLARPGLERARFDQLANDLVCSALRDERFEG